MADRTDFLGTVLQYEGEQFRVSDLRERSVSNSVQATLEPENPQSERMPLHMDLATIESKTQKGQMKQGVPDPRRVHQSRSEYAQKQDEARNARLTTDPEKYASDPDSWDFPGVDSGPKFRSEQPDFDADSFLDRFFDF